MLKITHGYYERMLRQSGQTTHTSTEQSAQVKPSSVKPKKIHELDEIDLLEKINKVNQENENIRRENLLFSRYLLRVNSSKIVKTFNEYEHEDENEIILEILDQTKPHQANRQLAIKRSSTNTKKGTVGWSKVPANWSEHIYTRYIFRIEQQRFAIAAYEVEQTRLEWQRMKAEAAAVLYDFEVAHQSIESDRAAQETLNRELQRRVDRYRADIGEEEFNKPYMRVPGELVVGRINKRIQSRISLIGLIRVNTARLHIRINEINTKIRHLDDLHDKMEEVDVASMHTRKLDHSETYEKVTRTYRIEKSAQYSLFRHLQDDKHILHEQEQSIHQMKKKCELLQNHLERTVIEILAIRQECEMFLKENISLKHRITDIMKVPTITDYAHIMEQTKVLQHGIDIWTKRVHIAETLYSQLKRQEKPPRRLPPLPSTSAVEHLLKDNI